MERGVLLEYIRSRLFTILQRGSLFLEKERERMQKEFIAAFEKNKEYEVLLTDLNRQLEEATLELTREKDTNWYVEKDD